MQELDQICTEAENNLSGIKTGSLRFWGVWFGRPHDNLHALVECKVQNDVLQMRFDMGEMLFVWSPQGVNISKNLFIISDASRVRWEWLPYGSESNSSNKSFQEFTRVGNSILFLTNYDAEVPSSKPDNREAAVEII